MQMGSNLEKDIKDRECGKEGEGERERERKREKCDHEQQEFRAWLR